MLKPVPLIATTVPPAQPSQPAPVAQVTAPLPAPAEAEAVTAEFRALFPRVTAAVDRLADS